MIEPVYVGLKPAVCMEIDCSLLPFAKEVRSTIWMGRAASRTWMSGVSFEQTPKEIIQTGDGAN
jgi:hypothetical protein